MAEKHGEARKNQLSANEISSFCAELALIIKAGVPVQEGISMMCEDTHDKAGSAILAGIREDVEGGHTLAFALSQSGYFPKYMVDMVEIGEASGRLDEVMDSLCAYYERNEAITRSIKNAVTYPAVMLCMMLLVILVLMVKVLPIFGQVFLQLGSEMSAFSQGIMNVGAVISRYSVLLVALLAIPVLAFFILRASQRGRAMLSRWYDSFFLTRRLSGMVATGRFASAMSLMLSSGLDTDRSLEMVCDLIENEKLHTKIVALKEQLAQGKSFSDALVETGVLSGVYARIITVGFKTGSVDSVMKKIAQRYEEEIDGRISHLLSILEPTLVAILSVIVGMILLSVMLPLMGIMSSIG